MSITKGPNALSIPKKIMVKVLEFCLLFIVVPFFNSPAKLGHFYGMEYFAFL